MALGTSGAPNRSRLAEINVTPMIDVLLVLLVIFMLAQPLLQRSLDLQLPVAVAAPAAMEGPPVVLEIDADGGYRLNQEPIPSPLLAARLRDIYRARADRVLFIAAHDEVRYQDVITAMDLARGAGVEVLGAVLAGW